MKLSGKAKEDFETWVCDRDNTATNEYDFKLDEFGWLMFYSSYWHKLPESMQYGVLVDWFDSVGIILDVQPVLDYNNNCYTKVRHWMVTVFQLGIIDEDFNSNKYETRPQARLKAIEKANEIYNKL